MIGAGLAGASAALEAAAAGSEVLLVGSAAGSSPRAQGGIAAALEPDDSPARHADDTIRAGAGLCDPATVRSITAAAPEAMAWLVELSVDFAPEPGLEGAHSQARVWHVGGDRSGAGLMYALDRALAAQPRICRRRDTLVALGPGGARLVGGVVKAGATVLATGGYAGLFERSTNGRVNDGQGLIAALDAGARLADLEFVQFHPTVFAGPGRPFLVTEALRGAGARLLDEHGRRFVDELASRAEVALAIARRGICWLDATEVPGLTRRFPSFARSCAGGRSRPRPPAGAGGSRRALLHGWGGDRSRGLHRRPGTLRRR